MGVSAYGNDLHAKLNQGTPASQSNSTKKNTLTLAATSYTSDENHFFSVQAGVYNSKEKADRMMVHLINKGYQPYIVQTQDDQQQTLYIIRIGDYVDIQSATKAATTFNKGEHMSAVVTQISSVTLPDASSPLLASSDDATKKETVNDSSSTKTQVATLEQVNENGNGEEKTETTQESAPSQDQVDQAPIEPEPASSVTSTPDQSAEPKDSGQGPTPDLSNMQQKNGNLSELQQRLENLQKEVEQMKREAEIRKKLETTEEEKASKEKEILSAAGREYTLMRTGTLGFEYGLSYAYRSYDVIQEAYKVEHNSDHTLTNAITLEYALWDNITLNATFPFEYEYDKLGTDDSKTVTDLGDPSFGIQYQPMKAGGRWPTTILTGGLDIPLGRSPYEIIVDKDLATSSGFYALSVGMSMSSSIDPVIAFGNVGYSYKFSVTDLHQKRWGSILEEVDPGSVIGLSMGMGYAISYKLSVNVLYQYSYGLNTEYHFKDAGTRSSGTTVSSLFRVGTGWRISENRSFSTSLTIGLTNDDPDFLLSLRIPFEFKLLDK